MVTSLKSTHIMLASLGGSHSKLTKGSWHGQSYAHCRCVVPNPQNVKQTDGARLHLLIVTMLSNTNADVLRSDEGLRTDYCFLVHIA